MDAAGAESKVIQLRKRRPIHALMVLPRACTTDTGTCESVRIPSGMTVQAEAGTRAGRTRGRKWPECQQTPRGHSPERVQ